MSSQHPWDIALGSSHGASLGAQTDLLTLATAQFMRNDLTRVLVDDETLFKASHKHNLSNYAYQHCKTPSFQIEINRTLRDPINQPNKYRQLMVSLSRTVYTIANHH